MVNFTPHFSQDGQQKYDLVSEHMTPLAKLITLRPEDGIGMAMNAMTKNNISGAPVLGGDGNLVGIISEKDCLKVIIDEIYHNLPPKEATVGNYMSKSVKTVDYAMNIIDVANKFIEYPYKRYPVIKDGKLVGQISRGDALKAAMSIKTNTW